MREVNIQQLYSFLERDLTDDRANATLRMHFVVNSLKVAIGHDRPDLKERINKLQKAAEAEQHLHGVHIYEPF